MRSPDTALEPPAPLPDQAAREAVVGLQGGPLELLAPHGTGKTTLLVERYAHLLRSRHTWPQEVVLLTFSRIAAEQLKERAQLALGQDLEHARISTLHSFARSILATHARATSRVLRVFDPRLAFPLCQQAMQECGLDRRLWSPHVIWSWITDAKECGHSPASYRPAVESRVQAQFARVFARYEALLHEHHAVDFAGLIAGARRLLEREADLLAGIREQTQYLMVDEWQDVSLGQYALIHLVAAQHRNLVVAGAGQPQSIFTWRQARYPELRQRFVHDFPEAQLLVLQTNFRSTRPVIEAAAAIFQTPHPELDLIAWRGNGPKIQDVRTGDEFAEAAFVARQLLDHARQGVPLSEMAVLYRTNEQSWRIEHALHEHGVPYTLPGRPKLYHLREVRDLLAYLRLALGDDPAALTLILDSPPRGIGPVSLRRLRGDGPFVHLWQIERALTRPAESRLTARALDGLRRLRSALVELRAQATLPPAALIAHLLERTGYHAWLQDEVDGVRRMQSLRHIAAEAEGFETTAEFLAAVEGRLAQDGERPEGGGVTLATIHGAKGLEFRVVCLVGLNEGLLPHHRARRGRAEHAEQCLAHVGITRARDMVYLVSARSRPSSLRNGRREYPLPSRYLGRLPSTITDRTHWPEPETRA